MSEFLTGPLAVHFAYFLAAVGLLIAAITVYVLITPYDELKLIRKGNVAAACSLGGTIIGFSLVIWSVAAHALSVVDMVKWGGVALACQLLAFLIVRCFLRDLTHRIEDGDVSYGVILASVSIGVGAINAGVLVF